MKSKAARVFGGFTQQSWKNNGSFYGEWKKDEKAFIFSMERKQIYRVKDAQNAIFCHSSFGPSFGGQALQVCNSPLNDEESGYCYTNGYLSGAFYGIASDSEGNHEVTGEGHNQKDDEKIFAYEELEVYGV
jgi:hypothetical protein